MDAAQVKVFCDATAALLTQLGDYASVNAHEPEDDAAVRKLRVSAAALAVALDNVARMLPPPMPPDAAARCFSARGLRGTGQPLASAC
jgi:hypothetical protein